MSQGTMAMGLNNGSLKTHFPYTSKHMIFFCVYLYLPVRDPTTS